MLGRLERRLPGPATRARTAIVASAWALLVALLAVATTAGDRPGVVAGALLVIVVATPGLSRLRVDPLDAIGIYSAFCAVSFGLLSLVWLGDPALPPPGIDRDDVSRALLIVAGGLAAFLLAARVMGPAQPRSALRFSRTAGPSVVAMSWLFALAVLGTGAGLLLGTTGYAGDPTRSSGLLPFSQVFVQVGGLGALVVLACALQAFAAGDSGAKRLLGPLVLAQVGVGFLAGFKGQSLLPLVLVALAYIASTRRVPWRAIAVAGAVSVVLLVPANVAYRTLLQPPPSGESRVNVTLKRTEQFVTSRFRLVDHVALIDARTPEEYARGDGSRYRLLPALIVVPRYLWPDKPVLDDGLEFSHTYWEIPGNVETSTPLTQVGDLLRNFGLLGAFLGLGVWGLVVGSFARVCRRLRSARVEMVYLVSLVSWIAYVESDLPQLVAAATKSLVVTTVVAWLLLPGRSGRTGYRRILAEARRATLGLRLRVALVPVIRRRLGL